ncbi:glycosyltransferase [Candidatus Dependentiae bacterium]|nr:glycosyltransferase [Candidatus Dependentiae bacterium]
MNLKHQYSDNIQHQKILIFGPELPPIGGVSIHVLRVTEKYKENFNEVKIIDVAKELKNKSRITYAFFILRTILKFKPTQIDYHTSYFDSFIYELFVLIILKFIFRFKIFFIDHDPRYLYKKHKFAKIFFNFLNIFLTRQIIIGSSTYKSYLDNKIKLKNYALESSFLLPCEFEYSIAKKTIYPKQLKFFFEKNNPIIIFNGFEFLLVENQDIYGFDRAINLIINLKKDFKNIGLLILCSQIGNKNYFNKINEKIIENNLNNNILLLTDNYPLWPLFEKANIFIRPTRSDSYGISIEEALNFNIPAIASDVCLRPNGTILFDNNNEEDLYNKTFSVLKKLEK